MVRSREHPGASKLLGSLAFVSRTFEGYFKDTPFVLDMDANLYLGPADHVSRDAHSTVEVVFHFLSETGRIEGEVRTLLDAFAAFDRARVEEEEHEFRILLHGTYDGALLVDADDDDLPAGPCGQAVNQVKLRFYRMCRRLDPEFKSRELDGKQRTAEKRLLGSAFARDEG